VDEHHRRCDGLQKNEETTNSHGEMASHSSHCPCPPVFSALLSPWWCIPCRHTLLTRRSTHIRNTEYPSPNRPYPPKQLRNYSPPLPYPNLRLSSNLEDDTSYHLMKLNSSTFLCALPHVHPPSAIEDDTKALTKAEEEKERHRARKRGWELLRPLEGNCMYFVLPPSTIFPRRLHVGMCVC